MKRKDLRKELNKYHKERLAKEILNTPKVDKAIKKGLLIAFLLSAGFMLLVITGSIDVNELFKANEASIDVQNSTVNNKEDKEDNKKKYYTIDEAQKEKSISEDTSKVNESEYVAPNLDTDRKKKNVLNAIVDDSETLTNIYNDTLDNVNNIKDFKLDEAE